MLGKIKQIKENIEILWHSGYYDGPVSGACQYNGKLHWFDLKLETHDRTFFVWPLTEEQEKVIRYWHEEFKFHSGLTHEYEYDPVLKKRTTGTSEPTQHEYVMDFFYEEYEKFTETIGSWTEFVEKNNTPVGYVLESCLLNVGKV